MRHSVLTLAALAAALSPLAAFAEEEKGPRFMSLKHDAANGRRGPSDEQPILWRYSARGLPMEVMAKSGDWTLVKDPAGDKIWMANSQLTPRPTVYVKGKKGGDNLALVRAPGAANRPVAFLEPGVIATLQRCEGEWRLIRAEGREGWAKAEALFGAENCAAVAKGEG
jgi:SH3-like domain-containing protein